MHLKRLSIWFVMQMKVTQVPLWTGACLRVILNPQAEDTAVGLVLCSVKW